MANARSIVRGVAYAGLGIAGGMLADYAAANLMQGSVPYFNNVVNGAGNIALGVCVVAGVGAGIYEAFFSPCAQNPQPPANVVNPNIPNAGPRVTNVTNIHTRGGRNIFRF